MDVSGNQDTRPACQAVDTVQSSCSARRLSDLTMTTGLEVTSSKIFILCWTKGRQWQGRGDDGAVRSPLGLSRAGALSVRVSERCRESDGL